MVWWGCGCGCGCGWGWGWGWNLDLLDFLLRFFDEAVITLLSGVVVTQGLDMLGQAVLLGD